MRTKAVYFKLRRLFSDFWRKPLEIYSDGGHKGRYGSWAFVILKAGQVSHENSARVRKTSSHRMEYQAAIEGLKALPLDSKATLYSDSRIVIDSMSLHAPIWQANGWLKENGSTIANVDLVQGLYELSARHRVTWKWVRAHSGNVHNERCDELCRLALST